jgi:hypothetical protein
VISWSSSPLAGEVICRFLWDCGSSIVWVSFPYAKGSVCCSWMSGFRPVNFMLCSGTLGIGLETSSLGLDNLAVFLGVLALLSLADRVASALVL